ncbi:MAG: hypothetical protein OHK0015_47750 [Chloroflexi bacterium OHK40]
MRQRIVILLIAALISLPATAVYAQVQICVPFDQSTETVVPGVTLTWDSSFRCESVPRAGTYTITVRLTNATTSNQAVTVETLQLSHTTPRPRRQAPSASATPSGLPVTVGPGQTASFTVSGNYTLVTTNEGDKANLHLRARGSNASGQPFQLGINVHLRGPGAVE